MGKHLQCDLCEFSTVTPVKSIKRLKKQFIKSKMVGRKIDGVYKFIIKSQMPRTSVKSKVKKSVKIHRNNTKSFYLAFFSGQQHA